MSVKLESYVGGISTPQLETVHERLRSRSTSEYQGILNDLNAEGKTVFVQIVDGTSPEFRGKAEHPPGHPDSYAITTTGTGGYDYVITITAQLLMKGTYKDAQGNSYPLTVERVLAHEMSHVDLLINDPLNNTETLARSKENDIMDEFYGVEDAPDAVSQHLTRLDAGTAGIHIYPDIGNTPDYLPNVVNPNSSWIPIDSGIYPLIIRDLHEEAQETSSPLALDISGLGVNLAELGGEGTVYWKHNPSSDFAYSSGWIAEGTGLLAVDCEIGGHNT